MAFDFLGTFTEDELSALLDFAFHQLLDVEPRIQALRSRIDRIGWISFHKDEEGIYQSYSISSEKSQIAKYVRAYEFFGGNMLDIPIRSRGDWLFLTKGEPVLDPNTDFQGGKVDGASYNPNTHKNDAVEGIAVSKVKDWMIPSIKAKREEWEFRIKKSVDEADQCLEEIILLIKRHTGSETIEDLRAELEFYLTSPEFSGAGKKNQRIE